MMLISWSDLLYLAIGVGIGFSVNRWRSDQRKTPVPETILTPEPTDSTINYQAAYEAVSKQLKQTQLAYQMAAEMCQFKAGFLARTSHELRSPLSSMIGTLQLITAELCDSPEEERQFVEQAHISALKMVGMIDDIVFVSKTEHGSETMDIQPLSLAEIFAEIEDTLYLQAGNRSIILEITPPDGDLKILADRRRFKQVLINLIDTAIAQMERGTIKVSVKPAPESGYVNIWIDDQRPISAWSESWDLLKQDLDTEQSNPPEIIKPQFNQFPQLSPGMRLLLNQTLLGLMQGRLEVLAMPTEKESSNFTRTQCSIPIAK